MKGRRQLAMALLLCALCMAAQAQAAYDLTDDEYEIFYEICDYLHEYWDAPLDELLDELAYGYGVTVDELYEFIEYAVFVDSEHVWVPVNGGTRFHKTATCSQMLDPRPATKDMAFDMGFTPCGRCKPGY